MPMQLQGRCLQDLVLVVAEGAAAQCDPPFLPRLILQPTLVNPRSDRAVLECLKHRRIVFFFKVGFLIEFLKLGKQGAKTRVRGCSTSRDVAALLEALDRSKDGLELDTLREALPISPPAPATRVSDRGMKSISKSLSGRMALWTVR
jgi:hypothetical protein